MDRAYVGRNGTSRERLALLIGALTDDDLARLIDDDWTAGAMLAHLAFWDRFVLARWENAIAAGLAGPIALDDRLPDLINDASLPEWRVVPVRDAADLARAAAATVDAFIAGLPDTMAEETAVGRVRMLERSHHRNTHLDAIEAALRAREAGASD